MIKQVFLVLFKINYKIQPCFHLSLSYQNYRCFSQQENDSLQRLISTIQKLHNQLLQYPGSFLLYRFYEEIQELPLLMASEQRQTSLLQLLNDLLYLEDGRFSLIETPDKTSKQPYNRLYSIIKYFLYSFSLSIVIQIIFLFLQHHHLIIHFFSKIIL